MPYDKRYLLFFLLCFLVVSMKYPLPIRQHSADILIISPHPDDAVLCCAGLIQQSASEGKRVHIVNITDGDGYQDAASMLSGKSVPSLAPRDMLRLGRIRIQEEIRAMNTLGIRNNVTFLGYPDGWLDEVYHQEGSQPFTNPFTLRSYSYPSRRPFVKTSIIADISTLVTKLQPKQIYVSGPTDSALDHQIVYRFVQEVIRDTDYTGRLLTYTNHASESAATSPLLTIELTEQQARKKAEAIESYTTQLLLDGEYLRSFISKTETFY